MKVELPLQKVVRSIREGKVLCCTPRYPQVFVLCTNYCRHRTLFLQKTSAHIGCFFFWILRYRSYCNLPSTMSETCSKNEKCLYLIISSFTHMLITREKETLTLGDMLLLCTDIVELEVCFFGRNDPLWLEIHRPTVYILPWWFRNHLHKTWSIRIWSLTIRTLPSCLRCQSVWRSFHTDGWYRNPSRGETWEHLQQLLLQRSEILRCWISPSLSHMSAHLHHISRICRT